MKELLNPDDIHKTLKKLFGNRKYKQPLTEINDDDCGILKIGKDFIVFTSDFLNFNPIAIELGIGSEYDLGKLLVANNLSDLCGTGAKPIGFLSSITMKKGSFKEDFLQLMTGSVDLLDNMKIPLLGGDTKLGSCNSFCGTAIGIIRKGESLLLKNNAKINEDLWVSGCLGSLSAAVKQLKNGMRNEHLDLWAKNKILKPLIPIKKSRFLSKNNLSFCGTDLSDGLVFNTYRLAEASNVGIDLFGDYIPMEKNTKRVAENFKIPSINFPLTIGGDFQFIFTSLKKNRSKLKKKGFSRIGKVRAKKGVNLIFEGNKREIPFVGHSDFKRGSFLEEINQIINKLNIS